MSNPYFIGDTFKVEAKSGALRCQHPDKYETSFMGDSGVHCPDCGYST